MRNQIHKEYWSENRSWDSKRQFISSCVTSKPVQRSRPRDSTRANMRTQSNVYSFTIETAKESVCKTFFLNTLAISESFMRVALVKTSEVGMVKPDKRGRHSSFSKTPDCIIEQIKAHIRKYPSYESHYSRERTKKKYLGSHLNISYLKCMHFT